MPSWVCNYCEQRWPPETDYMICPLCREPCNESVHPAGNAGAAKTEKAYADFGWWLYDHGRV